MLYLAYDGSLNGDWTARYAIRSDIESVHLLRGGEMLLRGNVPAVNFGK
jgi:hypothetical protein